MRKYIERKRVFARTIFDVLMCKIMIMMERVSDSGSTLYIVPRCETHWMNNHIYSFTGYIIWGCGVAVAQRTVNP